MEPPIESLWVHALSLVVHKQKHAKDQSYASMTKLTNWPWISLLAIKRFIKIGTLGRTYISTAKCLMENSDLITRTSYGKNNGENTITSIEWFTQVYSSTINETYRYRYALHTCISWALGTYL